MMLRLKKISFTTEFQFHNGAIQIFNLNGDHKVQEMFQFHNGAIQMHRAEVQQIQSLDSFNSIMVQFK